MLTELTVANVLYHIWLYGILFLLVMTLVVFVHELGHYLAARFFGVRADLFAIGFGREVWGRTDRKGTRWSLRMIPCGGYVRLHGEYPVTTDIDQAYINKPVSARTLIVLAGPVMNFLFALLFLTAIYMTIGHPNPPPLASAIEIGSPADLAGFKIGDIITTIDGVTISTTDQARMMVADKIGQKVTVTVDRQGQALTFMLTPKMLKEKNDFGREVQRGYMGMIWPNYGLDLKEVHAVAGIDTRGNPDLARTLLTARDGQSVIIRFGKQKPENYLVIVHTALNPAWQKPKAKDYTSFTLGRRPMEDIKRLSPYWAVREAAALIGHGVSKTVGSFYQVIAGTKKSDELGGMIRISTATGDFFQAGFYQFLSFVALLSVSLGLINLFPIPLLDGGHLLFLGAEAVRGSPVSAKTRGLVYAAGLIFVLGMVILINVHDLLRLFKF